MNSYEQKIFNAIKEKHIFSDNELDQMESRLKSVEGSLELMLSENPKISSKDILSLKAEMGDLPPYDIKSMSDISADLLSEIPEEAARQYKIVPLEKKGNKLKVGMVEPENYNARDAMRFISMGSDVVPELYVITWETFQKILGQYKTLRGQIKEALEELEEELKEEKKVVLERAPEMMMREAPVTKVVAVILKHAVEGKASDIHIEAMVARTRVRFRVYGKLYTSLFLPSNIHASVVSRIKILSSLRLDESRIPQDGRFSAEVSGRVIDFRVSTFPTRVGEKVVLRVLDPSVAIQDFKELGLVGSGLEKFKKAMENPFGMILISGPTGSGKSTTLYAALSSMEREVLNVVSLEDPIEYRIEGVNQSQTQQEIGYTFASGLRHILRQDPDIIMVGEIRDSETADLATHASLTGHLVFSSIHTNDAIGVIPRLVDLGVASFLVPSAVIMAIGQRLVRRLCSYCKVSGEAPQVLADIIKKEILSMGEDARSDYGVKPRDNYEIFSSPGCDKCSRKGTLGRIAIFEVLVMTKELKNIIYGKPTQSNIKEEATRQGMITMRQDGIIKALQGIISIEEVLRVTEE